MSTCSGPCQDYRGHRRGSVVFLTEVSLPGGSEHVLARLAAELLSRQHTITVLGGEEGWLAETLRSKGIPVRVHPLFVGPRPATVRSILWLRRALRSLDAQLAISWTFTTHVLAALSASGTPCRVVPNVRGLSYDWATPLRRVLWRRLIAPRAARVVCVSQSVKRKLSACAPVAGSKALVIPNGVDPPPCVAQEGRTTIRRRLGLPEDCFLVGCVGRVHAIKGQADLVAAIGRVLAHAGPPVQLVIAGYADQRRREELLGQVRALGLDGLVHLLGHRTDVPDLLSAMDLFILPSYSEGMPNALLEAMAAGVPAIATRVGGSVELIREGVSGLLVPPGEPGALAAAIRRLRADPGLGRRLARNAREEVLTRYRWVDTLNAYEALLGELVSGSGPPH